MIHPDGTVMCLTSKERAEWFLDRDLAKWENGFSPEDNAEYCAFRLTFIPGGKGKHNNPFYIQERENICVCCGKDYDLNRHHVFPTVFRKHMSTLCKSGNSHDVLPICTDCHEEYEIEADKLKAKILNDYGIKRDFAQTKEEKHNKQVLQARTMLRRLGDKNYFEHNGKVISPPPEVIEVFKKNAQMELIDEDNNPYNNRAHWGKMVMNRVHSEDAEQQFVEMWRKHFVDTMKPKFMPKFWSIEAKLEYLGRARKDVVLNERDEQLFREKGIVAKQI